MTGYLAPHSEDFLFRTIGAIYEAAAAPARWHDALEHLRRMFGLSFAASVVRNADRSKVDGVAVGVERDDYRAFLAEFYQGSPFLKDDVPWYPGQIVPIADLVPARVFHRTRMYQEFWRPHDLHQGVRMAVARSASGIHHSVNLLRPRLGEPFGASDLTHARALMPHLQRATALAQRLQHADMLAAAALAALDSLRHSVLLLDQGCRVLHANAAGEALLAATDAICAAQGVLHAATPALTNRLQAQLAKAAGADGSPPRANALRLPKRSGGSPCAVLVMPFRHEAHWSLPRRPAVLVCVTDPDAVARTPGRLLVDLFGLTGAEAALVADLLAGKELRAIAEERGRSVNTLRTQLATLMAKTGVNRQSQLLRLIASLPLAKD